jgi:hypothetical protein
MQQKSIVIIIGDRSLERPNVDVVHVFSKQDDGASPKTK